MLSRSPDRRFGAVPDPGYLGSELGPAPHRRLSLDLPRSNGVTPR